MVTQFRGGIIARSALFYIITLVLFFSSLTWECLSTATACLPHLCKGSIQASVLLCLSGFINPEASSYFPLD